MLQQTLWWPGKPEFGARGGERTGGTSRFVGRVTGPRFKTWKVGDLQMS
jgi:hypothetical protein